VKCWGQNYYGQVGDATVINKLIPTDVRGLTSGVAALSAGGSHTCALTTGGGLKCWGWNLYGQLGDGTTTNRSTPVSVSGLASGMKAINGGSRHTCALTSGNAAKCWGWNAYGQLGNGTTGLSSFPVDVSGLASGVNVIRAGYYDSRALLTSGGLRCWGDNQYGELGDGTYNNALTPVIVYGFP
jgi:alpha-tubulin suppressor-like RCC1 family protein